MAINMGDIEARVTVDTGQATKALTSLKAHIETLESELDRVNKGEVKVGAKVERSMQDAVKLSRDLYDSLTQAGKAADNVHAPKDMSRALAASRQAAEGLASSLEQAGAATSKVNAPRDMSSTLTSSASAAEQLAQGLDRAGNEAEQLGSKSSSLPKVDSALTGLLGTVKQLAPALSAAAVGGTVLSKGWSRLTAIDTAQFKLQGLGHTAESTAEIMDSAMTAVKGTAFGFGDAASIAASAVASGIKPGEQLTQVLTTIADTSAISGRSLGEMGAIFNKIAASGIIQGEELNQLADSGVPVLQLLSQELGVTAGEVKKLASEGKIGFAEFEAAMRSGMGGAAQEMGASILGSLQNVGAAAGRLGAAAMTPFVDMGTSAIGELTGAIDTVTKGVEFLGKGFSALPGPLKSVAASVLLVKGAMVAMNTEMGVKAQGHLKKLSAGFVTAGSAAKKFGIEVAESYNRGVASASVAAMKHKEAALAARSAALSTRDGFASADLIMQQFGHNVAANMNAATGHMRGFATAGVSVASSAITGLSKGLSSLVGFLGGPLGVGLMAGTFAFGQLRDASARLSSAQDQIKASAEGAAEAQETLRYAVAGTSGALTGEGLVKATEVAKNSLTELMELGEAYQGFFWSPDTDASWGSRLFGGEEWQEDFSKASAIRDAYSALDEVMGELQISKDSLNRIVAEGGPEFDRLIAELEASGPAGQAAAAQLRNVRDEVDGVVDAGRSMPEAMKQAADGLDTLADSSSDAEQKMKAVEKVMQALGLLPQDLNRAMLEQAEAIQKVSEEAQKLEAVPDLFGPDGTLNWDNVKIQPVVSMLDDVRTSLETVAANGGDARVELEKWEPVLDTAQQKLGLTDEQMASLRQQMGLMPDQINTLMNLEGADEATQKLIEVYTGLKNIPEGQSITLDAKTVELVRPELEAVGAKLEELGNGDYAVSLSSQDAVNQLGELAMHGNAANSELSKLGQLVADLPEHKAVRVETLDDGAAAKLEDLGVKIERLDGGGATLQINDTQVRDAMGVFDALGAKITELPDGRIDVTGNTPEVLESLERIGLAPKEFEGRLYIDDNTTITRDNIQSVLDKLGAVQGKTVNIDADPSGAQAGAGAAQGAVDSVHGKDVAVNADTSGATGPLSHVKGLLDSLKDKTINIFTKHSGPKGSSSGFADGGLIPRLASGDLTHGGYQLPMTGPGTNVTDGILGLDAQGLATAWVDRGEYVTNRAATQKYLPWLEAINADDMVRLAQLAKGVPGLAGGGSAAGATPAKTGTAGTGTTSTTVTVGGGALGELGAVTSELGVIEEGAQAVITADTTKATPQLEAVDALVDGLPDKKGMGVTADTAQPSKALTDLGKQVEGLTAEPNEIGVVFDAAGLDDSVTTALNQITDLSQQEAVPVVGLDTEPLEERSEEATGVIEELGAQNPVPVADMDNDPLLGEVAEADGELNRLGSAKSTSVADVDNSSALANINATITELNKMPVERVIKIVAHGSMEGLAGGGKVKGLATGGQVEGGYKLPTTGPGTGTVDGFMGVDGAGMPLVRVNAGEWVINRRRSEEYDKELELINSGRFPKLDDIDHIPGLFKGGVVSPDQLLGFARGQTVRGYTPPGSLEGSPYIWGGGLLSNWGDCSGAMSGLAALASGGDPNGRKFATASEGPVLASMGFRPGLGPSATSFNIGWFNGGPWGGHTSGTIGGTNVEMGGGRGNGQVGGPASGAAHPQYTDHAWLPLGELVAFDYFRPIAPVSHSRVPAPAGGYSPVGGLGVGPGGLGVGTGGAGVTLHDQGGWLQPGGVAVNHLDKPEPVLAPDQWATFESAVRAFPGATEGMIQAARSLDNVVAQMSKWSETPVETAKAWRGLATGELNAENILAAGRGQPLMGLGVNAKAIIGNDASNKIVSLAGKGGFAAQANGALEQELVVNIAMSEHTIRAAENLEKAREEEAKASESVEKAEEKLREAREKQADQQVSNAKAVRNAEEALANARREAGKPVKTTSDKKNATAEDNAKAATKAAESQEKNANKVRDAEEKLAEARKKQTEGVKDNADAVKKAEEELNEARTDKVKAAAKVIEAQTGLQVATIIAAFELVEKVASRVGDTVVGAFDGVAAGATMLVESVTRLGENMTAVAKMFDAQLESRSAALTAAQNNLTALERLREAERSLREAQQKGYRDVQAAEFDLRMTRWDAAQVAGAAEIDLAELRKRGIFDVHAVASAGDRTAIKAASDVAKTEARLANVRAESDRSNFEATRAVTLANFDLEEAQVGLRFETRQLEAASKALARAQAAASGEIGGQTALERYLQGMQEVSDAEAKRAAMISKSVSTANPITWFRDMARGKSSITEILELEAESNKLRQEGEAKMAAYRQQALQDIARLSPQEQAMVEEAIAGIEGLKGYKPGDVMTGITAFLSGDGELMAGKKKADAEKILRELNTVLADSKYRIEAAALESEREGEEIARARKLKEIEFQQNRITEAFEAFEQADYYAEMVSLTRDILEGTDQENKQLGDLSSKLDQRNKSVLMSIGGAGWGGDAGDSIARGTDFGGVAKGDLSLWESMRMESGWENELLTRVVSPVADTLADAIAAGDDGYKERPLGLPDTVVDNYYTGPVEGASEALRDAARRSQRETVENTKALQSLTAQLAGAQFGDNGTRFTGPVTVNSSRADELVGALGSAMQRG